MVISQITIMWENNNKVTFVQVIKREGCHCNSSRTKKKKKIKKKLYKEGVICKWRRQHNGFVKWQEKERLE